jgi:hypothetical protein
MEAPPSSARSYSVSLVRSGGGGNDNGGYDNNENNKSRFFTEETLLKPSETPSEIVFL